MSSLLKVMNYILEVLISSERVEIDKQKGAKTYIAQAVGPYNSANQSPLWWSLHQMHSIPVNRWAYWQEPCRYLCREWMHQQISRWEQHSPWSFTIITNKYCPDKHVQPVTKPHQLPSKDPDLLQHWALYKYPSKTFISKCKWPALNVEEVLIHALQSLTHLLNSYFSA